MRKELIIVRGLPGAGKTTLAKMLIDSLSVDLDVAMCAADDFFYTDDGKYEFDLDLLHKAHLSCQQDAEIAMQRIDDEVITGKNLSGGIVIVHNTSTTNREMKPYFELADTYGFDVTSLIVENRHGNKSVHNVPEATLERMKGRFDVKL